MISTPQAQRIELQSRRLVAAYAPALGEDAPPGSDQPWYIGLLLGVSGWVAGLFLLVFVVLLFNPRQAPQAAFLGVIVLIAACALLLAVPGMAGSAKEFVRQFALALSIAGQILLLFALNEHARGIGPLAVGAVLLQAVLVIAMPDPLHRTLSAFFATTAWPLAVRFALFGETEFWHGDRVAATVSLGQSLGGWLLAWLPVGAAVAMLLRREAGWMAGGWQPVARPVLTGAVIGLAFATVASYPAQSLWWFNDAVPAGQSWLALWPMLSALAALGAMAAAFALQSRVLIGACAVAALLHVSYFYYELGISLLMKSLLMLVLGGVAMLAARALARRGLRA